MSPAGIAKESRCLTTTKADYFRVTTHETGCDPLYMNITEIIFHLPYRIIKHIITTWTMNCIVKKKNSTELKHANRILLDYYKIIITFTERKPKIRFYNRNRFPILLILDVIRFSIYRSIFAAISSLEEFGTNTY